MAVLKESGNAPGRQGVRNLADDLCESEGKQQQDFNVCLERSLAVSAAIFPWSWWCTRWILSMKTKNTAREPGRSASENWMVRIIFQGKDGGTIETRGN